MSSSAVVCHLSGVQKAARFEAGRPCAPVSEMALQL